MRGSPPQTPGVDSIPEPSSAKSCATVASMPVISPLYRICFAAEPQLDRSIASVPLATEPLAPAGACSADLAGPDRRSRRDATVHGPRKAPARRADPHRARQRRSGHLGGDHQLTGQDRVIRIGQREADHVGRPVVAQMPYRLSAWIVALSTRAIEIDARGRFSSVRRSAPVAR